MGTARACKATTPLAYTPHDVQGRRATDAHADYRNAVIITSAATKPVPTALRHHNMQTDNDTQATVLLCVRLCQLLAILLCDHKIVFRTAAMAGLGAATECLECE